MKTKTITEPELQEARISSLPTRPTAPLSYGGKGFTASEMKAAFDRLPNLIAERLNSLIEDISEGEIASVITTGIPEAETLDVLTRDIKNGNLAAYLTVFDSTLAECISSLRADVDKIKERLS